MPRLSAVGISGLQAGRGCQTANAVPALIASADAALPAAPTPILAGAITGLPPSGRFVVRKPDGTLVDPQGAFVANSASIETGTYTFGATIGNPNDCFAGAWSAHVAALTDTLPRGSGATTAGGSVNQPACATGAFESLLSVVVARAAPTGGFTVSAQ